MLSKIGIDVDDGITNFQDLSMNLSFNSGKLGTISLFGFGGLSDETKSAERDSMKWENEGSRYDSRYFSNTGVIGLKHIVNLNPNTYLQSSVVVSGNDSGYKENRLDKFYRPQFDYVQDYLNGKFTLSSVIDYKLNARSNMKSGIYFNRYDFRLTKRFLDSHENEIKEPLNTSSQINTVQLFSQWQYRVNSKFTFSTGFHFLMVTDNKTFSIEPRASIKYDINEQQSFSMGYGLHSQIQPVGIYESIVEQADGAITTPNKNLGLNKSHHFVLAYDRLLTKYLRVKAEAYYQSLFNIAVSSDKASPLSSLNVEEDYLVDALVNKGVGRNYGVELTVEQFTHNGLYFLFSSSLFNSKYKTLENVWRNSRFNSKRAFSLSAGKEYPLGKDRTISLNGRVIYAGGLRTTPIDIEKSIAEGQTRYVEKLAFTEKMPDYFRADIRISMKRNKKKSTRILALDIQNVTNHKNLLEKYFDPRSSSVKKEYQFSLLPVLSYRVEF
jgi:hypothetical protein